MLFSVDDAWASVSSDGVVVNGGARRRDEDETRLDLQAINRCRGFMIDSQRTLFKCTIEDSIVLECSYIPYSDPRWALRFTELKKDIDALPQGLKTHIRALGIPAPTNILRILLARTILARPQILIFDGIIHTVQPTMRETILRQLCSRDEPWSVIFMSNDANLTWHVDRRLNPDWVKKHGGAHNLCSIISPERFATVHQPADRRPGLAERTSLEPRRSRPADHVCRVHARSRRSCPHLCRRHAILEHHHPRPRSGKRKSAAPTTQA